MCQKEVWEGMEEKKEDLEKLRIEKENEKENIFSTEEIELEELAIDGICGVY